MAFSRDLLVHIYTCITCITNTREYIRPYMCPTSWAKWRIYTFVFSRGYGCGWDTHFSCACMCIFMLRNWQKSMCLTGYHRWLFYISLLDSLATLASYRDVSRCPPYGHVVVNGCKLHPVSVHRVTRVLVLVAHLLRRIMILALPQGSYVHGCSRIGYQNRALSCTIREG